MEKFEEYAKGIIDNRKAKGAHPVVDYCADDFVIRKDNDALLETYWKDDRGYIYVVPLWYNSQTDSLNTTEIQNHLINTREYFVRVGEFWDDSFDEELSADLVDYEDILFHCFWIFANDVSEGVEPRVLFDSVFTFHRKPGEPVWPK